MSIMSDIPKHPITFLPERVAVQYLTLYSVPSITHETGSVCRAVILDFVSIHGYYCLISDSHVLNHICTQSQAKPSKTGLNWLGF